MGLRDPHAGILVRTATGGFAVRRWLHDWHVSILVLSLMAAGATALTRPAWNRVVRGKPVHAESPAPTENWLREKAEEENKEKREAWIESLHRAAPGTDWRAIEAENRAAAIIERQGRAAAGERSTFWTEVGSANLAGRTHATVWMPGTTTLYVGSDLGGVWRGNTDGTGWQAISDGLGIGSHGLVACPGSPQTVVTINNNGKIYTTTNGGTTWFVPSGLPDTIYECVRILRDAASQRTVYLLTRGRTLIGGTLRTGWFVSRSEDGGVSFVLASAEIQVSPRCDIWMSRRTAGPLFLMDGPTLKQSIDQGVTFTTVGAAPLSATSVLLTGSEAGAPTFYAALKAGADSWKLYRSTDAGVNWEFKYTITDFWETLTASITNSNLVFVSGVESWRSTNGGTSFGKVNQWWQYYDDPANRLHADLPGMECIWFGDHEEIFFDTDGGTFVSYDGGATVHNISLQGLGVSQYYSLLTSSSDPYLIAAGAQDQGYQQSDPAQGSPYLNFTQLISGDYGHLTSTTRAHDYVYSVYPGFVLLQVNEAAPQNLYQLDFPPSGTWGWMPFILADPLDPDVFYFCADHLWKYERISGVNYAQTMLPQNFGTNYLTALAIAKSDYSRWYVANSQGRLWSSTDAGATWTQSASNGPASHYFYGTALLVSPTNPLIAYVGGAGYSGPAVYKTVDGGVTWTPMSTGLPNTLVFGLTFDNDVDQNLFASAEAGPYRYDAGTATWSSILGTEAPLTNYWCLESVPELSVIRYGTYGRGIWDYRVFAPASADEIDTARPGFRLDPNPARERATARFDLAAPGRVRIELFDVTGRRVTSILDATLPAGPGEIGFSLATDEGRALESGVYFARMTSPAGVRVAKVRVLG
jgi:photosystem II stability/assembly factor-like uncharacterized protein